ncbi:MAG: PQQ-like beta-propeller repeat protein [Candidatus Bathyarchaeota archaeon]|nr:PQQ-like beta-propeller repeat protein [Candidatus Bathyarchaeota archaeon]
MNSLNLKNESRKLFNAKTTATVISLLLFVSVAAAIIPSASAATYTVSHTSYVYCSVSSSLIGVGQDQLLVYWTADMPPDTGETEGVISGAFNRATWSGVSFNVTAPDGTSTIYDVPTNQQDSIGGGYVMFAPDQVGTYTVQALFPAQWKNTTLVSGASTPKQYGYPNIYNQYYTADESSIVTFTVQTEALPLWNESPLPTAYWTRPINDASRLWSQLGGNWLQATYSTGAWLQPVGQSGGTTTRYVYGTGTETSHILWTRQYYVGGIMDERFGETGYQTGHYQGLEFNAIILNGRIYYADRADAYTQQSLATGINVVDLYSGELLGYYNNTKMPSYGQIYDYESPNQHGGFSMLWTNLGTAMGSGNGTVLAMQDGYALPLRTVAYIANATQSGTNVVGATGEMLWYNLVNYGTASNPNYYLTCWNNTNVLGLTATGPNTGTTYWQWRPEGGGFGGGPVYQQGRVLDGSTGYTFNVSIPTPIALSSIVNQTGSILTVRVGGTGTDDEFVILGTMGQNNELGDVKAKLWCLSLEQGSEGKQLWTTTYSAPYLPTANNETSGMFGSYSMVGVYPEDNVVLFHSTKQLKYWAFDMKTGQALWETEPEPDNNYYSTQTNYYNHTLLTTGYGGVCIAYDMATGKQVWNYTATNIGGESPYGNYPLNIFAICDDKIYLLTGEHSVGQPMWRGPNIRCISATDGSEIWTLLGMSADNGAHLTGMYMQMGDGRVVGLNYFDNQIYCIGPGTSATTVSAPQLGATVGSSVMITGTVTDQTQSGRRNTNNLYDFTLEGTPAVSDDSMSAWMEYLYENQAMPTNTTGVPVTIDAIDPNGNYQHLGDVTSDATGTFALQYKPEVSGTYQIIATFAGSKGYSGSYAQTYFAADDVAATPTPAATPVSEATIVSAIMTYTAAAAVAIIVAIAVVAILILRKRP